MAKTLSGDALLKKIKPTLPTMELDVCMRPDLVDEYIEVELQLRELDEARTQASGNRLGAPSPSPEEEVERERLVALKDDLAERVDEASPTFKWTAMSTEDFQALTADNPPRKDNELDAYSGYNRDAVNEVLIRDGLLEPKFSDEGWAEFKRTCHPGEWHAIRDGVIKLNGNKVKPPKLRRGSRPQAAPDNASE